MHQLVTKYLDTQSFFSDKYSSSNKTDEIMAMLISRSASAATTGYSCRNSILPLVSSLYV
jgi:hypothetical protein